MDNLATRIKVQQILKDLKLMYFNDYRYILKFSFTLTKDDIFLRLLYRAFNQRKFQYKLLTLSSKCNLEKDLQPILYNIYRRNLDVETHQYKISRHESLHMLWLITLTQFQFWNCHLFRKSEHGYASRAPLVDYLEQKFHSYLTHPTQF